jgi:hypothetical protein
MDRLRVEPYPFGLLTMIVSLERAFCRRCDDQPKPRRRKSGRRWPTSSGRRSRRRSSKRGPAPGRQPDPGAHQGDPRDDRGTGACRPDPTGRRLVDELVAGVAIRCCILPQPLGPIRGTAGTAVACAELSPRPALSTLAPSCGHPRWSRGPTSRTGWDRPARLIHRVSGSGDGTGGRRRRRREWAASRRPAGTAASRPPRALRGHRPAGACRPAPPPQSPGHRA